MSSFNHKATLYSGGRCRTLKIDSANTNTTLEKLVVTGFVALFLLFLLHCLHSLGSGRHCAAICFGYILKAVAGIQDGSRSGDENFELFELRQWKSTFNVEHG
jgi:hypothetical protein